MKSWKQEIEREREEKDRYFKNAPQSPISIEERASFEGLNYYPLTEKLRFELALNEHKEKRTITVEDTQGGIQEYLRWGEFRFEIDKKEHALQAYKRSKEEEWIWVPFKDKTSGKETYGAGRYIDLEPSRHKISGVWRLDFNRAYNPFCAYSQRYICPFIPPENWLEIPIRAGEKKY